MVSMAVMAAPEELQAQDIPAARLLSAAQAAQAAQAALHMSEALQDITTP
jgi:hypothetical protein